MEVATTPMATTVTIIIAVKKHHHGGHIGKVWRKSFVGIGFDKNAPFCLIDRLTV